MEAHLLCPPLMDTVLLFNSMKESLAKPYDLSIKQVLDRSNSPLTLNGDSSG